MTDIYKRLLSWLLRASVVLAVMCLIALLISVLMSIAEGVMRTWPK